MGNKKCRIYAACGVSQTPRDNQIREEENRWIKLKLGNLCIDERKRKGYTQKQLSEKLEISDKTISKRERGNAFPEVSLLFTQI